MQFTRQISANAVAIFLRSNLRACTIPTTANACIISVEFASNLRPWVLCFECIFHDWKRSGKSGRIQNSPAPGRRTFVHDSLRRFSRSRSMQSVINSALERNSLAKRERLEKSCWNASCTPICKMLVVSLDFFPFIILSNIRSLSLLICFATTTTAALTDCIMTNQKATSKKGKLFSCCGCKLFSVVSLSAYRFRMLYWQSMENMPDVTALCKSISSEYEWNGTWYSRTSRIGFDLCNAFRLFLVAIVSCFWLLGHWCQIWLLYVNEIWEASHVLVKELSRSQIIISWFVKFPYFDLCCDHLLTAIFHNFRNNFSQFSTQN